MDSETRIGLYWAAEEMTWNILLNTHEAYRNVDKKRFLSTLAQILKINMIQSHEEPYHLCNMYLNTWKAYDA